MRRANRVVTGLSLGMVLLLSCQTPTGRSEAGPRTVEIAMTEFRFTPAEVQVRSGETVRSVLVNKGTVAHASMIGAPGGAGGARAGDGRRHGRAAHGRGAPWR